MFKVNNENSRTTSVTLFSTASIVYFKQVKVSWVNTLLVHIRRVFRNFSGQEPLGMFLKIRALKTFYLQYTGERLQWEKFQRLDTLFFKKKSGHFF